MFKKNRIETSTCHICLEDLNYKSKNIKKKCCPTKAFICNNCWNALKNNENIIQCPLCQKNFKDIESGNLSNKFECKCPCNENHIQEIKQILLKLLKNIGYEIIGIISFSLFIYTVHHNITTFTEELKYLISSPFFWIISFFLGIFIIHCVHIIYIILEFIVIGLFNNIKKYLFKYLNL